MCTAALRVESCTLTVDITTHFDPTAGERDA
jgi:hypothetical protein